jgi:GT2 family glycosyltransferase
MKIAFVCVNYNNSNVTLKYVESVLAFKKEYDIRIVVVDNASKHEDLDYLERQIQELKCNDLILLKSDINVGYFGGLNLGLNVLIRKNFDFIVVGNNDLVFQADFLDVLTKKSFDDNVLVIAPNILKPNGIHQNPHIVKKFTFMQNVYRKLYFLHYSLAIVLQFIYGVAKKWTNSEDRKGNVVEQSILMGYGACYILTNKFFDFFNFLDAPNFLMGEEGVLANQIMSVNGITLYCPSLVVLHLDHTSIGKLPSRRLYELNRLAYNHFISNCPYVQ